MTAASRPMRIAAAMSGGVDSSVTAALLKRQGHEVIGVTLRLYSQDDVPESSSCNANRAIFDARAAADTIGIEHHVIDCQGSFHRQVIEDFAATYAAGRTPLPCALCNAKVKFGDMLRAARDLGAEALATGHYVRRIETGAGPELHRAADPQRDQSYFLFAVTRAQLDFLRFPLGEFTKPLVREMAGEIGLANAEKPDSQDICFIPGGNYGALVRRLRPEAVRPGPILDDEGRELGRHDGIVHYTVGQRKRLNIPGGDGQWFVLKLDAARNAVVVGRRQALMRQSIRLERVNWLTDPAAAADCAVKVRSMRPAVAARVIDSGDGGAMVELAEPEEAIAPGQACVFYRDSRLLGGGWIAA